MSHPHFAQGDQPSLLQVLDRREERQTHIRELLQGDPRRLLAMLTLNIPGPVKNNSWIRGLAEEGRELFRQSWNFPLAFPQEDVKFDLPTGPEVYWVLDGGEATRLKRWTVGLEEKSDRSRIFDWDVYTQQGQLSRQDVGCSERSCYLCGKPAKICARSRAHTVDEMLDYLEKLLF